MNYGRGDEAMKNLKKSIERGPYASNDLFRRIASRTSHGVGSPWAFVVAFLVIAVWALTGPLFRYSDTWQLVINTGTTVVTFLMVFLIQNTQNRDSHALHLKLDELIRANDLARNRLMGLEDLTDAELDELQREFKQLAQEKLARRSRPPAERVAPHQRGGSTTSTSTTGARSSRVT
jgi:low affinity Fe/Cu permease